MRARVLILAGLALGAIGVATCALRDPPDSPDHIARECDFIAKVEARRMVRMRDYGPSPFEMWRASDRTGGAPRPDRSPRFDDHLPLNLRLLRYLPPKSQAPIDCGQALDAARVPRVNKYNDGPPRATDHQQYSRITFSPGGRYALARVSLCGMTSGLWDERSRIWIWRRQGETWEPITGHIITLEYTPPNRKPPMRCFQTPID